MARESEAFRSDANDPLRTSAGSKSRSAAVSCHGVMCATFNVKLA
jgi:hypothetical protein